jgi:sigma54-dependent transcription regulator
MSETMEEHAAMIANYERMQKERVKEVRRQVKIAIIAGRRLGYSLDTLLDAGIGIDRIRKVYRNPEY